MPPNEERRSKPRIDIPFPAKVQGVDANGESFEMDSVLDNFSAGGLYLRLARSINQGTELSVVVSSPTKSADKSGSTGVAAEGVALRAEPQVNGTCGVAVGFTRYRFL